MPVFEFTVKEAAGTPPKLTAAAFVKSVPVRVTVEPIVAVLDVTLEIVGAGIKVKPEKLAVPPAVVTETFPLAPPLTTANTIVFETTVNDDAGVTPKLTAVVLINPVPVMVIKEPCPPDVGETEEMVGCEIP
jgi:hypothetical protein